MLRAAAAMVLSTLFFAVYAGFLAPGMPVMQLAYCCFLMLSAASMLDVWGSLCHFQRKQSLKRAMEEEAPPEELRTLIEDEISLQAFDWQADQYRRQIAKEEERIESMQEEADLWAHEIKVPLSVIHCIAQEEKNDEILEQSGRIDRAAEMFLKSAKLCAHPDFAWRCFSLQKAIRQSLKNNSYLLIHHNFEVVLPAQDLKICTDPSWLVFVIDQIVSNAVKYRKQDGIHRIEFEIEPQKDLQGVLRIKDNGLGIPPEDLGRIFDKGFVGLNLRSEKQKSTGFGLYLCAKVCRLLQIGLQADSAQGAETIMTLRFDASAQELYRLGTPDSECHFQEKL